MTVLSDFVDDLVTLPAVMADGDRRAVPVNAVIADTTITGEAIGVLLNDGFDDLAYSGQGYRTPNNIQLDVYASTYPRLMELRQAIIDRYHGNQLTIGSTFYRSIAVTFAQESAAALNDTVYRVIITLEAIT